MAAIGRGAARIAAAALLTGGSTLRAQSWLEGDAATGEWGGLRPSLAEKGLAVEGTWYLEPARVFSGGVRDRSTFHNLLDVNVTLDLEPLLALPGAKLYLDAYTLNGRLLADDVGDWQYTSDIDSDPVHQIAEVWWEQRLFDGALRWKIGKVDATTEFGWVENASALLHSGLAYPLLAGLPVYPDPATSVNLFVEPSKSFRLGLGCYDGALQEGIHTGGRGPKTFLGPPADLFWVGEATVRWSLEGDALPGRLALGATFHDGTFQRFDGGQEEGTKAFYATFDQTLWREQPDVADDAQGIGVAMILDSADEEVSEGALHASIGVQWTGFLPERDDDVLGVAASWLTFSDDASFGEERELALELAWRIAVTKWISITPDLQYVLDPGGDPAIDNALVGMLRIELKL